MCVVARACVAAGTAGTAEGQLLAVRQLGPSLPFGRVAPLPLFPEAQPCARALFLAAIPHRPRRCT
jgi:hypothetical protein